MKCIEADALMQKSLDGAITSLERDQLDRHIKSCTDCDRAFAEYRSLTRLVRDWSRKDPQSAGEASEFLGSVLSAIERAPEPKKPAIGQIFGLGAFVTAVVGAIGYLAPGLQPTAGIGAVHPMGIVNSVIATLAAFPTDLAQSLQSWLTETPAQLSLNVSTWSAAAAIAVLIAGRVLAARRSTASGGSHG